MVPEGLVRDHSAICVWVESHGNRRDPEHGAGEGVKAPGNRGQLMWSEGG